MADEPMLSEEQLAGVAERLTRAGAAVAGPLQAKRIVGGRSNLTFILTDQEQSWVLRTPPWAGRTPSAHDVAREYRVTSALHSQGIPVPRPLLLEEDEELLGGPFTVVEFVSGRSIQSRVELEELADTERTAAVGSLVETLASLHRVDHVAAGLERFGRPDAYVERQLKRWSGQWEIVGQYDDETRAAETELVGRLRAGVPAQHHVAVVHGDYRIDNTIMELGAQVRVAAIVDWELSTIGDPIADVAMMCGYRNPAFDLIVGAPTAWTSELLPEVTTLAGEYEAAGGVRLHDWEFHLALAYYKIAVIAAGIDHRYRQGVGSGPGFATSGQAVRPFLEAGLALGRLG